MPHTSAKQLRGNHAKRTKQEQAISNKKEEHC